MTLQIWADAHRPVYHVEINSTHAIAVAARPEFWKRFDHCSSNQQGYTSAAAEDGAEPTQDVRLERKGRILWYFAVGDRSIYPDDLKAYEVEQMASCFADPFRFNTFGNLLERSSVLTRQKSLLKTRSRLPMTKWPSNLHESCRSIALLIEPIAQIGMRWSGSWRLN